MGSDPDARISGERAPPMYAPLLYEDGLPWRRGGRAMGAILGLGVTHYPPLCGRDEDMARILKRVLQDPGLPEQYRRPEGWPAPMREEYGADEGLAAARRHRAVLVEGFRET